MQTQQDLLTIHRLITFFDKQLYTEIYARKRQKYTDGCEFQKECAINGINKGDLYKYTANKEWFHLSMLDKIYQLTKLYEVKPTEFNKWCENLYKTLHNKFYDFYKYQNNEKMLGKLEVMLVRDTPEITVNKQNID